MNVPIGKFILVLTRLGIILDPCVILADAKDGLDFRTMDKEKKIVMVDIRWIQEI